MPTTLVTGASRGIGRAIATELARRGHAVLLAARGEDDLRACCEGLRAQGWTADWVRLDVSDPASFAEAGVKAQAFGREHGGLTGLCNNAGIAISAPLLQEGELAERHLEINFHGPRRLCEALVPALLEAGGGAVLNIASSAGLQGYAYVSAHQRVLRRAVGA
ncbi:MAG: SDR family NAD(P)-dependent oxidoreductase, partial [Planctomycetota bacterium]